jgi:hypothetical protein
MVRRLTQVALLALWLSQSVGAELSQVNVLGGKVSLLLPQGFELMSEDMRRIKYPSEARPTIVYTNAATTINIAINHTSGAMPERSMPMLKGYLEGVLKAQYPTATWLRSESLSRGGRTLVYYDLRAPALDTTIRNIMFAASLEGRLLIITFNCTTAEENEWASIGQKIVESIEVR